MADSRVTAVCEPLFYGSQHPFAPGVLSADAGLAAYETIVRAVRDAQGGGIHAIATAPINKEALALAGLPWRGHTEMLAELTHAQSVAMMFWSEKLRVVLATIHIPLASVPAALTIESVSGIIELTNRELPRFGIAHPRIALAGLNPHAGEHGILGCEETDVLEPAVARSANMGIDISGPFPGDTIFLRAMRGEFDAVDRVLSRPGIDPDQDGGIRPGGQRDARTSDHPYLGRSRNRLRYRRQGHRRSGKHGAGRASRGQAGGSSESLAGLGGVVSGSSLRSFQRK